MCFWAMAFCDVPIDITVHSDAALCMHVHSPVQPGCAFSFTRKPALFCEADNALSCTYKPFVVLSAVNAQLCTHDSQRVFLPLSLSLSLSLRASLFALCACVQSQRVSRSTQTLVAALAQLSKTQSLFLDFCFFSTYRTRVSGVLVLLFWFRFLRLAGFSFVQPFYKTT